MREKIKKVYYCDFCKKKGLVKAAIEKHENLCFHNPKNYRPCFTCEFLKKVHEQVFTRTYDDEKECLVISSTHTEDVAVFKCAKKENFLKTPQNVISKKEYKFYDIYHYGYEEMPVKCEDYIDINKRIIS